MHPVQCTIETDSAKLSSASDQRQDQVSIPRGQKHGPKTAEGKAAIAKAHTMHGRETRAIRAERSAKLAELYELEMLGRSIGMFEGRMVVRKLRNSWQPLGFGLVFNCLRSGLSRE